MLAGGKSTRMGKDKALIKYHDKPQGEYLFALLNKFCSSVYTSCNDEQAVSESLNPIRDVFNFKSPINGVLSAFQKFSDKAWLTVAVDMPNVDEKVLDLLVSNRDLNKVATCFFNSETKLPEPLLTIWEPAAWPLLKKFTSQAHISPRDFLSSHTIKVVDVPDNGILDNINSPDQLPKGSR